MSTSESMISAEALMEAWSLACKGHKRWLEDASEASEDLDPFVSRETDSCPRLIPLTVESISRALDEAFFERLSVYALKVLEANRILNLVSRKDPVAQIHRNIMDALPLALLWDHVSRETEHRDSPNFIMDAGSGSGVPGIPVAMAIESFTGKAPPLLLVESRGRKAEFLWKTIEELELERAEVWNGRLEDQDLVDWLEESGWPAPGLLMTRGLGSVSQTLQWCRKLAKGEYLSSMLLVKGSPGIRREWEEEGRRWPRSGWEIPSLHLFVDGEREFCALEGHRPLD
jgi:16S rRNA G527 N7-methylase RsmG